MEYEIGEKIYVQNKLVWGQVRQLVPILKGIEFQEDITVSYLLEILGDKIPIALAVVLTEKGKSIKDKDIVTLASEFEEIIELDIVFQVIEDFFSCNPVSSLLKKAMGMIEKANLNLGETP